jgi:hypothetical protein
MWIAVRAPFALIEQAAVVMNLGVEGGRVAVQGGVVLDKRVAMDTKQFNSVAHAGVSGSAQRGKALHVSDGNARGP